MRRGRDVFESAAILEEHKLMTYYYLEFGSVKLLQTSCEKDKHTAITRETLNYQKQARNEDYVKGRATPKC